jgi:SAM-dependent methyltransferase
MEGQDATAGPTTELYGEKDPSYFSSTRDDYVDELPHNPSAVLLDIGCGEGATGALAVEREKCGTAYGIELMPSAASIASSQLDEVVVGDAEQVSLPWKQSSIDIVILSEVLEHLRDPWSVLRRVRHLLRPGALVFASSPNVAHHRIIRALVQGRWDLAQWGPMDHSHLRWFTPRSYGEMFEDCGYVVDSVGPLGTLGPRSRIIDWLTLRRLTHVLHDQVDLRAHVPDASSLVPRGDLLPSEADPAGSRP